MKHELKIWPQNYVRVKSGEMNFQLRNNDRGFQCGDTVALREWDPTPQNAVAGKTSPKGYTDSEQLNFKVGYVHVLDRAEVIFSLLPLTAKKPDKIK